MEFRAIDIANLVQGKIDGDENAIIKGVSKIDDSKPQTLSFLANKSYTKYIYTAKSTAVLVNEDFKADQELSTTLIRVKDAYQAIATLLNYYEEMQPKKNGFESPVHIGDDIQWTDKSNVYLGAFSYIDNNAKIGKNVKIYPQSFIGENVTIGDNTIIYPGVKIYKNCTIGSNCCIQSGAVIGSDGFGFAPQEDGTYKKIAQVGNVKIGNNVEVGANTTIDCATMGSTTIADGVKIDNLIQLGHNVSIGQNTVMAAQTGVAGSTKIGSGCVFAGQVGITGHITIEDNVKAAAKSGIITNVKGNKTIFGAPSMDVQDGLKCAAIYRRLPKLRDELNSLSKELKRLTKNLDK